MLFPYFMAIKTLGNEGPIFVSLIFDVFFQFLPTKRSFNELYFFRTLTNSSL